MRFVQSRKELFPRHPGHAYIQKDQVGRVGQAFGQSFCRVNEDGDRGSRQAKHPLDVFAQRSFVVDDKDSTHSVVPPANQ
jgi:hypothetical protein